MRVQNDIRAAYEKVKSACREDWTAQRVADGILDLAVLSLRFLESEGTLIDLVSRVSGKNYVSYRRNNIVARPANKRFFIPDEHEISSLWRAWENDGVADGEVAEMLYTVALAPCLAMELFDRQNKKGPATYFECLIGHLFAKSLGKQPAKAMTLPVHGRSVLMTMDFLFDMGLAHPNIHLPVKMSTRERVVQAWAHQRLLDSAYGEGAYRGIMVLFSETKMASRSLEVVEICVPGQWLAYQTLLSRMDRIYYFDVPGRYQELTDEFPDIITIRQFGEFFTEINSVVGQSPIGQPGPFR